MTKDSSPVASAAAAEDIENPKEHFPEIAEKTLEGSDVNGNLFLASDVKESLKGSKGKGPLKTKGSRSQSGVNPSSKNGQILPAEATSPIPASTPASRPKLLESPDSPNSQLDDPVSDPVSKIDSASKPKCLSKSRPSKSKNGKSKPAYVFEASDEEEEEEASDEEEEEEEEERVSSDGKVNDDEDEHEISAFFDGDGDGNDGANDKRDGNDGVNDKRDDDDKRDCNDHRNGNEDVFSSKPGEEKFIEEDVIANASSMDDSSTIAASSSSSSVASSSSSPSAVTPDASFLDPDMVEDQTRIERELHRARDQEEADRRMALKLQRLFQKEQYEELTKRPEGYGTRAARSSRSPLPRSSEDADVSRLSASPRRSIERRGASSGKAKTKSRRESPSSPSRSRSRRGSASTPSKLDSQSHSNSSQSKTSIPAKTTLSKSQTPSQLSVKSHFSKASSSSFSRSRSLATVNQNKSASSVDDDAKRSSSIDRNASADDERRTSASSCPHRSSSQGSENCSFCILTSPRSGKGSAPAALPAAAASSSQGSGKGKGLKRKTESPNLASKSKKKRKDSA